MSMREQEKAERERIIFQRFASAAGQRAEHGSINSERPPKPDISCIIEGVKHHFELGEITDQGLASRLAQALREMRITGGFFSQDKPLLSLISQKATKNYGDLEGPLDLVLYYDKQYPPPEGGLTEFTLAKLEQHALEMLAGAWSRIWIFDNWNQQILATWN